MFTVFINVLVVGRSIQLSHFQPCYETECAGIGDVISVTRLHICVTGYNKPQLMDHIIFKDRIGKLE